MRVLAIHTAGPGCNLALRDGETLLATRREDMIRGQDARLPGLVEALLEEADTTLDAIDRFAVVSGPGSFTGIRVGVAFARGLALAVDKPCIGVTSMEAALPAGQQGSALVALSAQKRAPDITYWTQTFRTGTATGPAMEMPLNDLLRLLSDRPHMLFGDEDALKPHFEDITIHAAAPSAARAASVASQLDPEERRARPTYVRQPDAALPSAKLQR